MELVDHELASERRYRDLKNHIHEVKTELTKEEHEMTTQPVNVFESGGGMGAAGGGIGGGALGGFLGAAIGNGGFGIGGNRGGFNEGVVTPMQLQTATGSIIDANQNTTLLQAVGDIKGAIPLAATQTALGISQGVNEVRSHLGQVENVLVAGQANINNSIATAIASSLASQNNINMNVSAQGAAVRETVNLQGTANLIATKDAQFALAAAIVSDGEKTRAMLVAQNEAALRNEVTALQIRLSETQNEARARGTEVNVTQTVNQNQAQAQAQAQQQQQAILLGNIWHRLDGMQQAIATNSNMIIGNTGAVATGPNTANPVNVRA